MTIKVLAAATPDSEIEAGEDDVNCPIDYILDCLRTIYQTLADLSGEIRQGNVNIAATTVENYRKLKEVGIGTCIGSA